MFAADRDKIVSASELVAPRRVGFATTFAKRDVFASLAARIAAGVRPSQLGRTPDASTLERLAVPASTVEVGGLRAVVLSLDRFGTLQLGCSRNELLSTSTSERVLVTTAYARGIARVPETFADVGTGELLVYEDSFEHLAVAVREGSVAALFGASAGDIVSLASL